MSLSENFSAYDIKKLTIEKVPNWGSFGLDEMEVEQLHGGCTNLLWKISHKNAEVEPKAVVFRKYSTTEFSDRDREISTMKRLAPLGITVPIYSETHHYRVEEFFVGSHPKTDEIFNEELIKVLARIHNLSLPKNVNEPIVFTRMSRMLHQVLEVLDRDLSEDLAANLGYLKEVDLKAEFDWLKSYFRGQDLRTGLCHNDVHALNIINAPGRVVLIDFEFTGYNYFGFEWANSFFEMCMDNAHSQWPHYKFYPERAPGKKERRNLIARYLQHLGGEKPTDSEISSFLHEIELGLLLSHFQWALWSIPCYMENVESHAINWGYLEYGQFRLEQYFDLKKRLVEHKH